MRPLGRYRRRKKVTAPTSSSPADAGSGTTPASGCVLMTSHAADANAPADADVVRSRFEGIEVRASVNMRIGTVEQMSYVADLFDGFCVQRDCNRDLGHLCDLRAWADANGKTLSLLANSGCLRLCPGQIFHDNLVAHEAEIDETVLLGGFSPDVCRRLYQDRDRRAAVLQATWIPPRTGSSGRARATAAGTRATTASRCCGVCSCQSTRRRGCSGAQGNGGSRIMCAFLRKRQQPARVAGGKCPRRRTSEEIATPGAVPGRKLSERLRQLTRKARMQ